MNMQPVAYRYYYANDLNIGNGKDFVFMTPFKGQVPTRVEHLYSADQMAMAQEAIKIEAALIVKGVLNGDIYAKRIRNIEILK